MAFVFLYAPDPDLGNGYCIITGCGGGGITWGNFKNSWD